jgi:hypothetical protein
MVFDRTCTGPWALPGLSSAWRAGSRLYRALGRLDATFGATSWDEALSWVASRAREREIVELQYWGHGRWGSALVDRDVLDARALDPGHALHRGLAALRERLAPGALVWFRTCETFGAARGQDFAARLADHLGARVAGHTYVIGPMQSGLRGLLPGARPDWSPSEGLAEGTAERPIRARVSMPGEPRTITCLEGHVPAAWFSGAPRIGPS